MKLRFTLWSGAVIASVMLICAIAQAAEPEAGAAHTYKLNIDARLNMMAEGQNQKIDAVTDFIYSWQPNGRERTVSFGLMSARVSIDGKEAINTSMSRSKMVTIADGQRAETPADTAPEALRSILQDSFDVPICKIQFDEAGKEVKRTIVAGPGAKALIESGAIDNALMFHPTYSATANEWVADNQISMGNGGFAKGKLTYTKAAGGKDGQQLVKVSGVLTNDGLKLPNTPATISARCAVSGQQTYDTVKQVWVDGKLAIDLAYDITSDNKPAGSAKGTMTVTLETVPAK